MFKFASASLLVLFCQSATAAAHTYEAQGGVATSRSASPRIEDVPPLFPVVDRLLWITWQARETPRPVEVLVNSSRAGYEEIAFSAAASVSWLHVAPAFAITPARLSVSVDPIITDAAGEIVISAPGATWEPVHIRVAARIAQARAELVAAVNGASFSAGSAPGAVVTLFGSHLGPAALAVAEIVDGAYPTEVAKTSFRLDGVPCPILHVSDGQSSIIVPYGVQPGRHTLEIAYANAGETYVGAASLDVAQAIPGVFTLAMNGRGPALALNEDYSPNSRSNPAKPGSWVMFYATGLGELETRPLKDGAPENRVIRHAIAPTASVGSKPAFVYYAGSAPGIVSAVSQVNIQIPADAPSGAVELKITSRQTSSQNGATIFVE